MAGHDPKNSTARGRCPCWSRESAGPEAREDAGRREAGPARREGRGGEGRRAEGEESEAQAEGSDREQDCGGEKGAAERPCGGMEGVATDAGRAAGAFLPFDGGRAVLGPSVLCAGVWVRE